MASTCRVALLFWNEVGHVGRNMSLSTATTHTHQELVNAFKRFLNSQGKRV